jgi:hypothetical protein
MHTIISYYEMELGFKNKSEAESGLNVRQLPPSIHTEWDKNFKELKIEFNQQDEDEDEVIEEIKERS